MIVDTSALFAILAEEDDAGHFAEQLDNAMGDLTISAGNYLEAGIVLDRRGDSKISARLDELLQLTEIEIAPVTETQARIARQAYRDFGKGSGHPARLNFGDCFAYALAKERGDALLFKGDDFARTDIRKA